MSEQQVLVKERENILEVVLNRPEKYNALTMDMRAIIADAVMTFSERKDLRVMLFRATGKYFCAGAEVSGSMVPEFDGSTSAARQWYRQRFAPMFTEMEAIEKPIVVAHQGPCLGGGLEMSLSCDFRLAARSARYGLPETVLGVLPGSGGTSRLTRLIGPHWARWFIMASQQVDADRALLMGLVHEVWPDEEFEQRVWDFCVHLASLPPETVALSKVAIELAADLQSAQARNVERLANSILFTGKEREEAMKSFLERQETKRRSKREKP